MNVQRFALSVVGAFVFVFVFEFLWHAVLMKGMYDATSSIWRPEEEVKMVYIFASQFLFAVVFSYIYTLIGKHIACKRGIAFGFFAGLLMAMPQLGTYCYLPIPLTISLLWMLAEFLKCLGAGMVIAAFYREKTGDTA